MGETDKKSPMAPEEFARRMREIASDPDAELGHLNADELMAEALKSLGYGDGIEIYDGMRRWYA